MEREAAEGRRSRLEQQASFERARAETQARDAERAQMLDRCLAEFQDDSVQLVTAVSRVSERLHDLSRQAAGQAHSNLGLVANEASGAVQVAERSEEHTSELQSLMRISYAGFCLKKKKKRL